MLSGKAWWEPAVWAATELPAPLTPNLPHTLELWGMLLSPKLGGIWKSIFRNMISYSCWTYGDKQVRRMWLKQPVIGNNLQFTYRESTPKFHPWDSVGGSRNEAQSVYGTWEILEVFLLCCSMQICIPDCHTTQCASSTLPSNQGLKALKEQCCIPHHLLTQHHVFMPQRGLISVYRTKRKEKWHYPICFQVALSLSPEIFFTKQSL